MSGYVSMAAGFGRGAPACDGNGCVEIVDVLSLVSLVTGFWDKIQAKRLCGVAVLLSDVFFVLIVGVALDSSCVQILRNICVVHSG